ncbi:MULTISPECIES: alpha/beta hydrolase [Nocardiopsidaceae]|uniref:Alpha/beta hydrolase n=1 Tax=Streptomonospora nanhaiensis TaxID=1323731 RepID=A0ABY6YTD8_9ACTN|nr:alpha/beta hydrolase [Streptomonospora nanhaiensis]WAE75388.1 alpha/beta hydrolase [Streptomonospora nanhaiensis]
MNTARLAGAAVNAVALPAPGLAGALARRLWADPRGPRPVAAEDLELHGSARTESFDVGRWKVVAYAWGDGARPVLLVHGWRSRAARLAPVIRRLLELGYSPVSWDAPGHGSTGGPVGTVLDAREAMRLLQDRHGHFAAVIGHSLGALFAVHALREGLRADRAVLVSGVSDFGFLVSSFSGALGLRPRAVEALRRAVERHYFDGDPTVWTRFSATHAPESFDRPVLLLHGEDDAYVPIGESLRTAAALGDRARLVRTRGTGHSGILADEAVLGLVAGFVGGAADPAPAQGG